ncbi:hypothetical protein [Ramlibacter pallidus]|uniref:Uncharacterized protein n=1 Tax=Ramlibacter pallidus TaxID=2780087 RepID=A0ABR9RY82_9BURK|nr:hypothetical protein [Ramlibacter pallidus]MBE7366208.1 hypothetical protein [Ramlibacter pallidus]
MPYYRVMLHGTGIRVPSEGSGEDIIGFYTTRLVRASSEAEAERNACRNVETQWTTEEYAGRSLDGPPELSTEWVRRTSFLDVFFFKATGHAFYFRDADAV